MLCGIILIILSSCKENHTPWDAGTPESNRLMLTFDSIVNYSKTFRDSAAMERVADRMAILARNDSLSKARWYFIKEYIAYINQNDSMVRHYADKGLALLDSARYPYETARFIYSISLYGKTTSDKYIRVGGPLKIFEEYNDSIHMASAYMSLGALHSLLNDYESGLEYSVKAHRMYHLLGDKRATYRLSRNISHFLINLGRKDEAFRIYDSLSRDPGFGDDNAVDCLVLTGIYDSTRNAALLHRSVVIRFMESFPAGDAQCG